MCPGFQNRVGPARWHVPWAFSSTNRERDTTEVPLDVYQRVISGWATILPELTRRYGIGAGNVPQAVLVNPTCCVPGDTAQLVASIMCEHNVGSVSVVVDQQ
jgi:hypothetical protein